MEQFPVALEMVVLPTMILQKPYFNVYKQELIDIYIQEQAESPLI